MTATQINLSERSENVVFSKKKKSLHLESTSDFLIFSSKMALRKKLSSRVTLLRRLVGSGWGAGAKTLRIATLSLVYSTAEYCAAVWCRSAHTRLINSVLNDALRIVTGYLRPTPTDHLPQGFPNCGTCTPRGTFRLLKGYIIM